MRPDVRHRSVCRRSRRWSRLRHREHGRPLGRGHLAADGRIRPAVISGTGTFAAGASLPGDDTDADPSRRQRRPLPGQPGRTVVRWTAFGRHPDRVGGFPGRVTCLRVDGSAVPPTGVQHSSRRLDRTAPLPQARTDHGRSRLLAVPTRHPECEVRGTRRLTGNSDHNPQRIRPHRDHVRCRQYPHRRRGYARHAVPDGFDQQGLDGHPDHAARRRRIAGSRLTCPEHPAGLRSCRRGSHRNGHDSPPVDSHQWHRR